MFNANESYEENYRLGPQAQYTRQKQFPKVSFLEAPKFSFLGIPLHLPFGIPAGPLLNANYMKIALQAGYCLPVYKTVRTRFWPCHPMPNVLSLKANVENLWAEDELQSLTGRSFTEFEYSTPNSLSITNSFGVPSQPPSVWQKDFESLGKAVAGDMALGQHAMLSFQGSRSTQTSEPHGTADFEMFVADSVQAALLAAASSERAGFSILEINLSCPNEKGDPIFKNISQVVWLLQSIHAALSRFINIQLVAKIGVLSQADCFELLKSTRGLLSGVSAINTVPASICTPEGGIALGSGMKVGGVCGSLILQQGLEMIRRLHRARCSLGLDSSHFALIGVGGVLTARDYFLYRDAGADAVQAATGAMWNANLALEIAHLSKVLVAVQGENKNSKLPGEHIE